MLPAFGEREGRRIVRFAVINGSREWTEAVPERVMSRPSADIEDVQREARRRLKSLKIEEWRVREFVTGTPVPDNIRHLAMQIEYAAQAIGRLSPIPADYADDVYWPRIW